MTIKRKPPDVPEHDLLLALARIQRGRAAANLRSLSPLSHVRPVFSTALIHKVAEVICEVQGRPSRAQRDIKHQDLLTERENTRMLCHEIEILRFQVANLASINEVLTNENRILKAKQNDPRIADLTS